jgi:hypothetical protein
VLQLEGRLRRTARRQAPSGGCQNISRLPQATEYQEYLAEENVTQIPARATIARGFPRRAVSKAVASAQYQIMAERLAILVWVFNIGSLQASLLADLSEAT